MKKERTTPLLRFSLFSNDWRKVRLSEVFGEFKSGNSITSKNISVDGPYPVYGGNGLRGFAERFTHNGQYVLIGRQGALCGNINLVKGKNYVSEHAIAGKSNSTSDTTWLAYRLEYLNLNRLSESSAQPGLSVAKLLRLKLIVPSLPEQEKIATFLTAVDERIRLLEQKKEKLETYKKGVMQQLFPLPGSEKLPKIRFKHDDGTNFPDWEEKKLGEVCNKKSSSISAGSLENKSGDYKIYGATGFLHFVDFYQEPEEFISIVKDGAGVGRILRCEPYSSVLGTLDILKPKEKISISFLHALLDNIPFKEYVTGSTIPHIYFRDYSREAILLPCLQEQKKIASFLGSIDKNIEGLNSQISKLKTWKKGLLQQMFV